MRLSRTIGILPRKKLPRTGSVHTRLPKNPLKKPKRPILLHPEMHPQLFEAGKFFNAGFDTKMIATMLGSSRRTAQRRIKAAREESLRMWGVTQDFLDERLKRKSQAKDSR